MSKKKFNLIKGKQESAIKAFQVSSTKLVALEDNKISIWSWKATKNHFNSSKPMFGIKKRITLENNKTLEHSNERSPLTAGDLLADTENENEWDSQLDYIWEKGKPKSSMMNSFEMLSTYETEVRVLFINMLLDNLKNSELMPRLFYLLKDRKQLYYSTSVVVFYETFGKLNQIIEVAVGFDVEFVHQFTLNNWRCSYFIAVIRAFLQLEGKYLLDQFLLPIAHFLKRKSPTSMDSESMGLLESEIQEIYTKSFHHLGRFFFAKAHNNLDKVNRMMMFSIGKLAEVFLDEKLAVMVVVEIVFMNYLLPGLREFCNNHLSRKKGKVIYERLEKKFLSDKPVVRQETSFMKRRLNMHGSLSTSCSDQSIVKIYKRSNSSTEFREKPKASIKKSSSFPFITNKREEEDTPSDKKSTSRSKSHKRSNVPSLNPLLFNQREKGSSQPSTPLQQLSSQKRRGEPTGLKTIRNSRSSLSSEKTEFVVYLNNTIHDSLLNSFNTSKRSESDHDNKNIRIDRTNKTTENLSEKLLRHPEAEEALGFIKATLIQNIDDLLSISFNDQTVKDNLIKFTVDVMELNFIM